jgi:type II secretory pathway pseudopilin PulG
VEGDAQGIDLVRLLVFPVVGFLAGFAAQWLLQARRSRDELVRALAGERAAALRQLWAITTLPREITSLPPDAPVGEPARQRLNAAIVDWYTAGGGALYLSWHATQRVFDLLDGLRSAETRRTALEALVSALRTRLKYDSGIYERAETRRPLRRPRPSPWE